jgi:orotate phosphoribosyltransferase
MTTHHASEFDRDAALTTARILLEIKAVNFRPDEPYTLTSGWKSPVYIDCRKIISYPRARTRICDLGVEKINRSIGFETIESIAGGETAGIPFAAWISDRMNLPMAYVRKKAKGFGRNALIEGDVPVGPRNAAGRGPHHRRRQQDPLRRGPARGGREMRPYLRGVLLRRFPRFL